MRLFRYSLGFVGAAALLVIGLMSGPTRTQAQLAAVQTWGGTAGGTANSLTIVIHNMAAVNDVLGVPLRFIPSAQNTGPATLTITLDGGGVVGPIAIQRPTSNLGLQALSGAEFLVNQMAEVTYDGTSFEISSSINMTPIGQSVELRNSNVATAPPGTLLEDGSCYSQTTYAALFTVIGTTYNAAAPVACTSGNFAVPDSRGTAFAALDNQGVNGAANRITSAGSGCTATAIGLCGSQNQTLTVAQIPSHTHANSLSDPGHAHSYTSPTFGGATGTGAGINAATIVATTGSNTTGIILTNAAIGGGGSHPILNPILLGRRAIKY